MKKLQDLRLTALGIDLGSKMIQDFPAGIKN